MKTPIALVASLTVALAGCGPSVTVEQVAPPDPPELVAAPTVPTGGEGGADGGARPPGDVPAPVLCDPPCDDGNPCTVNECVAGECAFPDDTELPACADGHAVCVAGECCVAPRCFDKGACVDACPDGATCNAAGTCE